MPTLVIHAPKDKAQPENSRSFETIFMLGVGDGYAIPHNLFAQLSPGCGVVLLNKVSEKRAEGNLVKLVQTGKIDNDVGIYDVHFDNIKMVPYKTERLDKNGVAVISTSQPALPDHLALKLRKRIRDDVVFISHSTLPCRICFPSPRTHSVIRDCPPTDHYELRRFIL